MTELSCREHVLSKSLSNLTRGGIGCVPVVFGLTVGAGVGHLRNTMQSILLVELRRPSLQDLACGEYSNSSELHLTCLCNICFQHSWKKKEQECKPQ